MIVTFACIESWQSNEARMRMKAETCFIETPKAKILETPKAEALEAEVLEAEVKVRAEAIFPP